MDKFGYPTNIKQIGNVDDSLRIYIEDYVYSYLLQYAEAGGNEERLAALVGRCMLIDGQTVLFINGAIQGRYLDNEKGILTFSNKSMEYVDNQIDKYFKGLEVVGWLQSQPNYGNFLSASYAKYHVDNFRKPYSVMLVADPIEKINSFFIWNEEKTDIMEAKGFFIYYDKNKSMHNYILDNKIVKFNKADVMETKEQPISEFIDENEDEIGSERISPQIKTTRTRNRPVEQKNKVSFKNYYPQIASFLLVITMFMGANVLNSNVRINKLEGDITNIRTAYNDLVTYINDQNTQPVFAQSTDSTIDKTEVVIEPVTTPTPSTATPTPQPQTSQDVQSTTTTTRTYTIRQGDSLISICKDIYGSDKMLSKLMEVNNISDPNKIYYGMVIKLPDEN